MAEAVGPLELFSGGLPTLALPACLLCLPAYACLCLPLLQLALSLAQLSWHDLIGTLFSDLMPNPAFPLRPHTLLWLQVL